MSPPCTITSSCNLDTMAISFLICDIKSTQTQGSLELVAEVWVPTSLVLMFTETVRMFSDSLILTSESLLLQDLELESNISSEAGAGDTCSSVHSSDAGVSDHYVHSLMLVGDRCVHSSDAGVGDRCVHSSDAGVGAFAGGGSSL